MVTNFRESALHIPVVGATGDEPISCSDRLILSQKCDEINTQSIDSQDEMERKLALVSDPAYVPTMTLNELLDAHFPSFPPIIEGLLYTGTYILAGSAKIGKSFLVAQLAFHVSTGTPLWGYKVNQGTVIYFALEDSFLRLQNRMSRMFSVEGTDEFHFSIIASSLGNGLEAQLTEFIRVHPDTKLVIIDTLQKVRGRSSETFSYSDDYDVISRLKAFTDSSGICLLLVHHTRKQAAEDRFDLISGTTGLMGCADGAILLQKATRTDLCATLDIVGRDQPDQRLHLRKDPDTLRWILDHAETELWKQPPDPLVEQIASILTEEHPSWEGSAAELAMLLDDEVQPNVLTRRLNVKSGNLLAEYGIIYQHKRSRTGSHIRLMKQPV